MHDSRNDRPTHSADSRSGGTGLLLGAAALLAGTTWCLRNHAGTGKRSRQEQYSSEGGHKGWALAALGAGLAGAALGKSRSSGAMDARKGPGDIRLASQVTILRPPEQVYQFWKDFSNLPRVMSFIERVEPREGDIYHWVARGPAGPALEWDAEIVDDDPGKLLAWRSLEGSDIQTWGTVLFNPREDNRGTELSVAFNFCPPGNVTGAAARFLSGLENAVLDQNLRNLKSQLEAGEVPTSRRYEKGAAASGGKP
ncbi:MAG: SRPBCC family protein [Marinobacter sp.]